MATVVLAVARTIRRPEARLLLKDYRGAQSDGIFSPCPLSTDPYPSRLPPAGLRRPTVKTFLHLHSLIEQA